jgi:hypothetical protein
MPPVSFKPTIPAHFYALDRAAPEIGQPERTRCDNLIPGMAL